MVARRLAFGLATALAAGVVGWVVSPSLGVGNSETLAPLSDEQFWLAMVSGDPQAVVYPTKEAMVKDAEVIVVGAVEAIEPGRALSGGAELTAYMVNVSVRVDEVVKGSVVSSKDGYLTLETLAGVSNQFPTELFDRLVRSRSSQRGLLMLVSRDEWLVRTGAPEGTPGGGRDLYKLLGGQAFSREVADRTSPSPFVSWADQERGRPFADVVRETRELVLRTR
jgi:hypothetical protein